MDRSKREETTGMAQSRRREILWTDFNGSAIYEGDTLVRPDGITGRIYYDDSVTPDSYYWWRVKYDDGTDVSLGSQVSDKGRVVAVASTHRKTTNQKGEAMKEDTENYKYTSHCPVHGKYYSGPYMRITRDGKEIRGSVLCPKCYDPLQSSSADKALLALSEKYFALMYVCIKLSGTTAEADVLRNFAAGDAPEQWNQVLTEVHQDCAEVLAKIRRLTPVHSPVSRTAEQSLTHEDR